MKRLAILFGLFIITIIILADLGDLGPLHAIYDVPFGDKLGHFILYGILALLVDLSLFQSFPGNDPRRVALLSGLGLALLIGLEEFSQKLFATRNFDLLDLTAGYLGVIFFSWLALRIKKRP
jgi:VanZ family protein